MEIEREKREASEKALRSLADQVSSRTGLPEALLQLISEKNTPGETCQCAAVFLKNLIKTHWDESKADFPLQHEDKVYIRKNILETMLQSPRHARKLLSQAIYLICETDFPAMWSELVPYLADKLQDTENVDVIQATLEILHSILTRYRNQHCLSESIIPELLEINRRIAIPLLKNLEQSHLKCRVSISIICTDVFYDLCSLDFGNEVESTLSRWMDCFLKLLNLEGTHEHDLYCTLRKSIIATLALFLTKYDEEFSPYLQPFVEIVWKMLQGKVSETDDETLISAMDFLTAAMKGMHWRLFTEISMRRAICEHVVLSNVMLRPADVELFENEPKEYVQRDIEGSDAHTRRRSACDLARALLSDRFQPTTITILQELIQFNLQEASPSNVPRWIKVDAALYLIATLSSGQKASSRASVTLCDVTQIYETYVVDEIKNIVIQEGVSHPVLKAACLKYVCCFRHLIGKQRLLNIFPFLLKWVSHPHEVLVTYSAHCVVQVLNRKESILRFSDIAPYSLSCTENLMQSMATHEIHNEKVAKALLCVISISEGGLEKVVEPLCYALQKQIVIFVKTPSNPLYNHYIFEILSRLMDSYNKTHLNTLDTVLWETLMGILTNDEHIFMPYVFQIIAQFVHFTPSLPAKYGQLLGPLLDAKLYTQKRLIPSLVRLLEAYLERHATALYEAGHAPSVLNIFRMLALSKLTDHEGFNLLAAFSRYSSADLTIQYLPEIFRVIFERLSSAKTTKLIRCVILYLSLLVVHLEKGPHILFSTMEGIQQGIFSNLVMNIWLPNAGKIIGGSERKLVIAALGLIVTDCAEIQAPTNQFVDLWQHCVYTLCRVHHCGHDPTETQGVIDTPESVLTSAPVDVGQNPEEQDELALGTGTLLSFHSTPHDILPLVTDPWSDFIRNLSRFLTPDCPHRQWYLDSLRRLPLEACKIFKNIFPEL